MIAKHNGLAPINVQFVEAGNALIGRRTDRQSHYIHHKLTPLSA